MKTRRHSIQRILSLILAFCMLLGAVPSVFAGTSSVNGSETESAYMTSTDWIWSTETITKNSISYFRKELNLEKDPVSLSVKASAHNHLKFYVNGNIITGYVSPARASLPENVNYLSYSFSGSELAALLGENKTQVCFAAAVQYMGDDGENYMNASPALWADIEITYGDGTTRTLTTDTTWHALKDTPYTNGAPSMQASRVNMQLDYDATKMPGDPLAWTRFGYDENSYTAGTWGKAVSAAEETKTWKMRKQAIPEGAIHEEITPTAVARQVAGWQVFDAGRIVTGWVKITASAPAGTRICIRYEEDLDGDVVSHKLASEGAAAIDTYCDYYTFSGNGVETFVADFDYKAFRYFEVTGMPDLIRVENVTVQWASTEMEQIATFSSSDEFLNKLYQACINTQINNIIGMPVDCPHREQSQYLADSQLQFALLSYAFGEYTDISYKLLLDFATSQFESGRFIFVAPGEKLATKLSIPEWDLRYSSILYQYYRYSGDLAGTAEFYDNASKNVEFYLAKRTGVGLLKDEGNGAWNISDHPTNKGVSGKTIPDDPGVDYYLSVVNILLYDSLNNLSKIATVLGKTEEAADWAETAAEIKVLINRYLLNSETGLYYQHSGTTVTNEGITAMAINLGVAEPGYLEKQMEALAKTEEKNTSVVLTYELFRAIMTHGNARQKEYLYDRMVQSWGPMIEKGYQTVWEGFKDQSSHSHAWNAYPAYVMLKGFAGIQYNGQEYSDISVKPFLPTGVSHMSSTIAVPGMNDEIYVYLERENGYKLVVDPPKGEEVLVAVPRVEGEDTVIKANNRTVFSNGGGKGTTGLSYVANDAEYVYFKITSNRQFVFKSSAASSLTEGKATLSIGAVTGGTVLVNGAEVSLPYDGEFDVGSTITLKAEPQAGFAFTGWSGSFGSTWSEKTFAISSKVSLNASFEAREAATYHTVTVTGPEDSGLSVSFEGDTFPLPASFKVKDGETITLKAVESEIATYGFGAWSWSGDQTSSEKEISLTITGNTELSMEGAYKVSGTITNLASGKTVISSNDGIPNNSTWAITNLTDGSTGKGASSNKLASATEPHRFSIDLGEATEFNKIILYARPATQEVDGVSGAKCFPVSYAIQISDDGSDWTTVETAVFENVARPASGGTVEIDLGESVTAQYVAIYTTKATPDEHGTHYVQLMEMEVFHTNSPKNVTLTVESTAGDKVLVNGFEQDLPYTGTFTGGEKVTLAPVLSEGIEFGGWTGDVTSTDDPLYLVLNRDCTVTANSVSAKEGNIALKKTASSHNYVDGAWTEGTANTSSWKIENLTDDELEVKSGNNGASSQDLKVPGDGSYDLHYYKIDFGQKSYFNQVVLYPRSNKRHDSTDNLAINFPTKYRIEISDDGKDGNWEAIYTKNGTTADLPNYKEAVTINFTERYAARYIRIVTTEIGYPETGKTAYHVQFCEMQVNYVVSEVAETAVESTVQSSYLDNGIMPLKNEAPSGEAAPSAPSGENSTSFTLTHKFTLLAAALASAAGLVGFAKKKKKKAQ